MGPRTRSVRRLLGIVAVLSIPLVGYAQTRPASESQLKAAFLYNFAKFVEWPARAFPPPGTSVIIGLLGEDPFGDTLDQTLKGKTCCHGKKLVVRRLQIENAATSNILFISSSEEARLADILQTLNEASVLTVSDMDRFVERGGMIGLRREGNQVRFEINAGAAKRAGLTISSQILKLATRVLNSQTPGS